MIRKNLFWAVLLVLLTTVWGCSSQSPIETGITDVSSDETDAMPFLITEGDDLYRAVNRGFLGAFQLHASINEPNAELIPFRLAAKEGDSFLTNLLPYFTSVPCADCLRIIEVSIDTDNNLVLTFETEHPFDQADILEPPSAKNRDDLRLFDVKLIVVSEDADITFDRTGINASESVVQNACGYTHIEDLIIDKTTDVDANIFPYIILAEDPSEGNVDPLSATGFIDLANASGHNVLNQGSTYKDDLIMNFPYGGKIDATLYMFGSYGQSAENFTDRFTPQYWLPEFNIKEPWKVEVEVTANTLDNSLASTSATVEVDVWDWQHSNTKVDPSMAELDAIKGLSAVTAVIVDVPGLNQPLDIATTPDSGNGLNTTPLHYVIEINNDTLADAGEYWGLVKVLDSREQGLNYGSIGELVDYDPQSGLDFIKIEEFATYQLFKLDVAEAGGAECGPITCRIQYGNPDDMFLTNLRGTELHLIDGSLQRIKVTPTIPNGGATNFEFDFDDPNFADESGPLSYIDRTYDNPNCSAHDPYELHLRITVTDDCDASADWIEDFTIYIHCGEECGPFVAGVLNYALNGGDYQPFPVQGITITHNDELKIKASGFNVGNGTIEKYIWDFDDPRIEDKNSSSDTVTRIITHPNCGIYGADPYELLLDLTVQDSCPSTADFTKQYPIEVECPTDCGPITGGSLQYSIDGSPFVLLPGEMITVKDGTEVAFKCDYFSSENANITNYIFDFDDPAYEDQSGASDTVTRTFDNTNCVALVGDPQFVKMTYTIQDDCITSADYIDEVAVQIVCAACYGVGLNFDQNHRVVASQANFDDLNITKMNGGGMKLSESGGGNIYAGYLGRRSSDLRPGIGFGYSEDDGSNWLYSQFIITPEMPGGFSIVTEDGITVIVVWYDTADNKIYLERSTNGGVVFDRTEIHQASQDILSISLAQDPLDPARIYLAFVEMDNAAGTSNSIKLLRSTDTGENWPGASLVTAYSSDQVYGRLFHVADLLVSPLNGDIYIAACQQDSTGSNVFVARSNNQGDDFMAGARVFSNQWNENIDSLDITSTLADPTGQAIYVAFAQGNESVGSVKLIKGNIATTSFFVINSNISDTTHRRPYEASIVADREGDVYVVWRDDRGAEGLPDIYADFSRDGGITFGEDKIVNDTTPGTAVRMSPEVIIAQDSCQIIVVYEDNSFDPEGEIFSRVG